jgi:para-nitrobenzyl esterase
LKGSIEATFRPELAARALPLYMEAATDSLYGTPSEQWVEDTGFRCPAVAQSTWHSTARQSVYHYEMEHVPLARRGGNTHAQDVAYVFGSLGRAEYTAADTALSDVMQTYWTNFAKTGNPNGPGLPQWPTFDAASRRYTAFTEKGARPGQGLRERYCGLFLESTRPSRHLSRGTLGGTRSSRLGSQ